MTRYAPLVCLALEGLVLSAMALDAHARSVRRAGDERAIAAVARLVPAADLSLAGSARHLRFPSLEEPGAAFADAPASPDLDPAGGAIGPPIDVYADIAAHQIVEKRSPEPLGRGPSDDPPK